jgi:hypothetical protein
LVVSERSQELRKSPKDFCPARALASGVRGTRFAESGMGLGCVKTRLRGKPIAWIFRSDGDLAHRVASAGSNSIDLRKAILAVSELWEFPHS